jgi:hypothetical protein
MVAGRLKMNAAYFPVYGSTGIGVKSFLLFERHSHLCFSEYIVFMEGNRLVKLLLNRLGIRPLWQARESKSQMQTKEQLGAQFTWELKNIKKDLESFLEMSRAEQLSFAPTLCSRIQVTSARLKLFRKTLGQEARQDS